MNTISFNGSDLKLTSSKHGHAAMLIHSRGLPVTTNPGIAKLVGPADAIGALYRDQLTDQALPEIEAVLGRVELGVCAGDGGNIVGHTEDAASVEAGVLLGGRQGGVDADDQGCHLVAGGDDGDLGGGGELGQVDEVCIRPRARLVSFLFPIS